MFSHVMVGSNDIARSKKFYDALFLVMGGSAGVEDAKGRLRYPHNGGLFMVTRPIDGKPATPANGGTIGFWMRDPKQVDTWHEAGTANGGATAETLPGARQGLSREEYLAYLRDPDGNKLCAFMYVPRIRPAAPSDQAAVEHVVHDAYRIYIPRIGKPPGPMLDDYAARIAEESVSVVEDGKGAIAGIIVLLAEADHLLLLNVAVHPDYQGQGYGRLLIEFAERQARQLGYTDLRLYTHEKMTENIELYTRIGFSEISRGHQDGYDRVFMTKRIE